MEGSTRAKLTDVNPHLVCVLCQGYLVDATTIAECLHSFCRSCIFRHLERKSICPICRTQVNTTKLHLNLKPDKTLQDIVYKLVPGLFRNEMLRRREFYKKHPFRDEYLEPECRGVGRDRVIYSPDDLISLSLEFYDEETEREEWNNNHITVKPEIKESTKKQRPKNGDTKRYLQCPAAFKMAHLKKFIRQKYGLSSTCHVDIIYGKEYLPDSYSLMDIAYIYTWKRNEPMRFYYKLPEILLKKIFAILKNKNEEAPAIDDVPAKELTKETKSSEEIKTQKEAKDTKEMKDVAKVKMDVMTGDVSQGESLKPAPSVAEKKAKDLKPEVESSSVKENPVAAKVPSPKILAEPSPKISAEPSRKVSTLPDITPVVKTTCSPPIANSPSTPNGSNGFITTSRQMSKQDELPVSVLLSLSNSHPLPPPPTPPTPTPPQRPHSHRPEPKFVPILPKCSFPRPPVERIPGRKILPGKLNSRMSVNKIASDLAEQNRLNKSPVLSSPQQLKSQAPPAVFSSPTVPALKTATPADPFAFPSIEPNVPTLTTSQPAISVPAQPKPSPKINGAVESSPSTPPPPPSPLANTNGIKPDLTAKSDRPEVTVNTSNGSLTISTQPNDPKTPPPQNNSLKLNGGGLIVTPETKPKESSESMIQQSNINNRLPTFNKSGPRKKVTQVVPGGVISKTGPTLDQRLQQLYKTGNRVTTSFMPQMKQASPPGKQPESRLANWLNNRFPPLPKPPTSPSNPSALEEITTNGIKSSDKPKENNLNKESETVKLSNEMFKLKRKLDDLRKSHAVCEITQENPSPELDKKRRDVKPDVSIEFMRATDLKKSDPPPPSVAKMGKEKSLKRPVPGLMSIGEVDLSAKKKCVEDEKTKKPVAAAGGKGDEALDLSGATACKPTEDNLGKHLNQTNGQLPWLLNRPPLMTNQRFLPRSS